MLMKKQNILNDIQKLYDEIPEINCQMCGDCCVSPTCTLVEFIFMMNYCIKKYGLEKISYKILQKPEIHRGFEGNLKCPFLDGNGCFAYKGRTGACRLFGNPVLKELGIKDLVDCTKKCTVVDKAKDIAYIQNWLDRLSLLNNKLYPFGQAPYFIRGFNLSCWLDLYFDPLLDMEPFSQIKAILHSSIDMMSLAPVYVVSTGLKEKVDKITLLTVMLDTADAYALRKLIISIRDDYPLTGTYFYEEANAYLRAMDKVLAA